MKLSEHFSLGELTFSETAARKGIENCPPPEALIHLKALVLTLEKVRALIGSPVIVTSGYRCPALNTAVGGSKTSAHVHGFAADINCLNVSPKALASMIRDSDMPFDQLILEYDRWVHIGLSNTPMRRQLLTIRNGTGYMEGIV